MERNIVLQGFVGAGDHAERSAQTIKGSAVFEHVESGWRFSTLDPRSDLAGVIEASRM